VHNFGKGKSALITVQYQNLPNFVYAARRTSTVTAKSKEKRRKRYYTQLRESKLGPPGYEAGRNGGEEECI
jgi:hypothetical protein